MLHMPFGIDLIVTLCLLSNPNHCSELRVSTMFVSEHQCQLMSPQALAEIMQAHPKRRVARWKCELVRDGEDI